MTLKTLEDFDDPIGWEAYLLTIFAARLNPKINREHCYDAALGYLATVYVAEEEPKAEMIRDLADDILEGPAAGGTH